MFSQTTLIADRWERCHQPLPGANDQLGSGIGTKVRWLPEFLVSEFNAFGADNTSFQYVLFFPRVSGSLLFAEGRFLTIDF